MLLLCWVCSLLTLACTLTSGMQPSSTATAQPPVTRNVPPATWTPFPTAAPTLTASPTLSPTPGPSKTPYPTNTPSPIPTATSSITPTGTLTSTPTLTLTRAPQATFYPTATPQRGSEQAKPVLRGPFDVAQAIPLLYGDTYTLSITINVLLAESFQQAGTEKYLILTEVPGADCHACQARIGGAVFSKSGNDWQLDIAQPTLIQLGAFGRAPEPEFVQIGPDVYGALFQQKYASTGGFGSHVVLITEVAGSLKSVLLAQTAGGRLSDDDTTTQWKYESELTFVAGDNPAYYDLVITTRGTRPNAGEIQEFEEVKRYTFTGQEYKLTTSEQP
ncbi:MAG: hypothetical protein JXA33_07880 [Anaerolineae bacterium]|nr:hypothetical protein [Anaerolineae bacterium]